MKKKNNLFKNIFYIFFAFCFLGAGIFTINQKEDSSASAEDTSYNQPIVNNIPQYFSVKDMLGSGEDAEENPSSLISSDTFLYYIDGGRTTELDLSLAMNGAQVNPTAAANHEVYQYVYYPDKDNTKLFYFYNVGAISLYFNGQSINLDEKNFVKDCGGQSFQNNNAPLQGFEMNFKAGGTAVNEINLMDADGNLKEGVYTLTLTITLFTCTDGNTTTEEEKFSDQNVDITYSFYVADREAYIFNNRPNVSQHQFDHIVPVSAATNPNFAYYLYYNYSSEGENPSDSNKIPYIEFDYTRFELSIERDLSNISKKEMVLFDKDTQDIITEGDDIIVAISDKETNTCKVFFKDVGNYSIVFNDIQVVEYVNGNSTTLVKNNLTGLTGITKKIMVYVYGYQANYTNVDGGLDANGARPTAELKDFDYDSATFNNSADITSEFVNSNINFSQDEDKSGTTFVISNIASFIGATKPIRTNQTPIRINSNATLSTKIASYVYSTTKVSNSYKKANTQLNGKDLYWATYNGRTESSAGTYIYIIAYTFNNFYSSETTLDATRVFYQVFYFEVVKDLPTISLQTEKLNPSDEVSEVFSDTFVNRNVRITDLTKEDPYNKDVTIRVYAEDFGGNYLSSFGGSNGIDFDSLPDTGDSKIRILEANAHFTIRMYFTNEMNTRNISITSNTGFFREQKFTIDKTPVQNISATNVASITNSTNFTALERVDGVSTNQNIAISWDEKASGARTFAYYKYFSLDFGQYYSKSDENAVHLVLEKMLSLEEDASYLPVNAFLNMSTTESLWLKYKGNAKNLVSEGMVSSEYVFTEAGLYVVDVYDEAGNHSVDVYLIDYTTPIFAILEDSYKIVTSSVYISKASTLFWAKYKGIFIENFTSQNAFLDYTPDTISESALGDKMFLSYDNKASKEIYDALYKKLIGNNYMKQLVCRTDVKDYTGMYLTIPVDSLSYFLDREHDDYTAQRDVYSKSFDMSTELTYSVLIRDASNTKYNAAYNKDSVVQYKNYYSASQTIIISFDSSEFLISYESSDGNKVTLTSNNVEEGTLNDDETKRTKTTYLNPTRLNKEFILSFYPTVMDGDITIQVGSVTINYYPYQRNTKSVPVEWDQNNNVTKSIIYHYYELSDSYTTTTIYEYNGDNSSTALREESIRLNSDNFTTAGRYEITRTYYVDEADTSKDYYNKNDFYQRTFILTIDRNEVVSNPELVSDENGNHLESLVGGDAFVSMYDNKQNASLVVTFPNSPEANSTGSSIYNNANPRTILTTNMLPVYVYVPQYKYTTSSQMYETSTGYDFNVSYDFSEDGKDTMNFFKEKLLVKEYALYAEIYRNESLDKINANGATPYARTAINKSGNLSAVIANENGFLNFYLDNGQKLERLTQAGTYYVKIYQGNFGTGIGEDNFTQALTFCFEVKQTNPNFEAQSTTGDTLNSQVVNSRETYYTNQPIINLTWEAGSEYIADIDIDEITLVTNKRPGSPFEASDDIWAQEPTLSNNMYTASLNLELLKIYENGSYVDITMQYKNHNDDFYKKVTKRITVDLSAPNTNINNLVSMSTDKGFISALSESSLRVHKTALGNITTNENNTSFNTSNTTGNFAYYSYAVTSDFAETLKRSVDFKTYINKFVNSSGECTKYNNNYEQETSPDNFHASNFTDITDRSFKGFDTDSYYQVIETDRAGNMSIYTIYIISYETSKEDEKNRIISYYDENKVLKSYSISDFNESANEKFPHNIYTRPNSQLQSINYFGDVWAQFKLDTYSRTGIRTTRYLMLTPWDPTHAYAFIGGNAERIEITDLIDTSMSINLKNSFTFFNRESQANDEILFTVNTKMLNPPEVPKDSKTREHIDFEQPTDDALRSNLTPQNYVTGLRITADDVEIFNATNRLGLSTIWKNKSTANVTVSTTSRYLVFELNPALGYAPNTRIIYEYTDNYGKTTSELHLYKETAIPTTISSENDLYAYNNNGQRYYITKDGFEYFYNPGKYVVNVYDVIDGVKQTTCNNANLTKEPNADGIMLLTAKAKDSNISYNNSFVIEIADFANPNNQLDPIYFTLYNELPKPNSSTDSSAAGENNKPGQFKLLDASRNNVTSTIIADKNLSDTGYFSEITLLYSNKTTFIPVKYSVSTDKKNWNEVASGTVLKNQTSEMLTYYLKVWYDETYLENELSNTAYVFGIVPESQIYEFNLSSLTSTFWVEKTVNNATTVVEKSNTIYTVKDNSGKVTAQYSNHYIVNVNYYTDKDAVQIKTNKEQKIVPTLMQTFENAGIASELWLISNTTSGDLGNIPAFSTSIVISYIPASENFVEEFYTYSNTNGIINNTEDSENLITKTSMMFVVSSEYQNVDKIELRWTKYYGLEQNEISIRLVKDGVSLNPTIYSKIKGGKEYNYINLKHSGKYIISFFDTSGNTQKFNYGNTGQSDTMTFIFLKDVPFTVVSTDPSTGEEVRSMPIKQAVYNNQVTLSIDKSTRSEFYSQGGYPAITIKKNGSTLSDETIEQKNIIQDANGSVNFVFKEAGFYEVFFTATSKDSNIGKIRSEVYQFTVLSANEYKYSYIINKYSNYYIEKVEKDGKDITQALLKSLDVGTIKIGTDVYMTELPLSYLDEKTGAGKYLITINSNDSSFKTSAVPTSWTFEVTIQVGVAPVRISVAEGKKITKAVTIQFNKTNIFAEMGECTVRVLKYNEKGEFRGTYYTTEITSQTDGETSVTIKGTEDGIFYMQIVSPSGNLLYSYKINKQEPMNPATIIIIVVAVIVALVILFIVIKLRKRISVK